LSTILSIVSITNYILGEIDNLRTKHEFYDAKMHITYDPSPPSVSVTVKDIEKDGEPINPSGLEMIFVNPDKSMQHYPLIQQGDSWNLKASPHIRMAGTCRIDFVGFKQNNERFNITGSSLVVVT